MLPQKLNPKSYIHKTLQAGNGISSIQKYQTSISQVFSFTVPEKPKGDLTGALKGGPFGIFYTEAKTCFATTC